MMNFKQFLNEAQNVDAMGQPIQPSRLPQGVDSMGTPYGEAPRGNWWHYRSSLGEDGNHNKEKFFGPRTEPEKASAETYKKGQASQIFSYLKQKGFIVLRSEKGQEAYLVPNNNGNEKQRYVIYLDLNKIGMASIGSYGPTFVKGMVFSLDKVNHQGRLDTQLLDNFIEEFEKMSTHFKIMANEPQKTDHQGNVVGYDWRNEFH